MKDWEIITRELHKRGGGPIPKSEFDNAIDDEKASRAAVTRAKKLGMIVSTGRGTIARWRLTPRGLDWCLGRVFIVSERWRDSIETEDQRQQRIDRLVTDSHEATALCLMLTKRQREVMVLSAKEFTRDEIAARLGVTKAAVANHMERLGKRLGVTRAIGVAVIAAKAGLV